MSLPGGTRSTLRMVGGVLFPAWRPMKTSAQLFRDEAARRKASALEIRDMFGEVRAAMKRSLSKPEQGAEAGDTAFEERLLDLQRDHLRWTRAYRAFLGRKRAALCMGVFFVALGCVGLAHGAFAGIVTMLLGVGLFAEIAWVAEFRLWQLRGTFTDGQLAGLREFRETAGTWKGSLRPEWGFGIVPRMRPYRRWLALKRAAVSTASVAGLYALFHLQAPGGALVAMGAALLAALLVEFRLSPMRQALGIAHPRLASLFFEFGAGHEEKSP